MAVCPPSLLASAIYFAFREKGINQKKKNWDRHGRQGKAARSKDAAAFFMFSRWRATSSCNRLYKRQQLSPKDMADSPHLGNEFIP